MMLFVLLAPVAAHADGSGSGSATPGAGAGSAPVPAPGSGSAATGSAASQPAPPPAEPPMTGDAVAMRKTCVAAMNADPSFADAVIKQAEIQLSDKVNAEQVRKDVCTLNTHEDAQNDVRTNERHVILAYAAMWLAAAGFVLFLWRRQQTLKTEIAQLRRDLDAATKDGK
ncbi:MAG: hypothetical protein ABI867_08820 [Kofleriaceae bacterium]